MFRFQVKPQAKLEEEVEKAKAPAEVMALHFYFRLEFDEYSLKVNEFQIEY